MKAIISPNVRIRCPDTFEIAEGAIVDDFCYFSAKVKIGRYSHIASGCSVAGGPERQFVIGDFSSLSSGVKVWCTSDDFTNDLVTIPPSGAGGIKNHLLSGDVFMGHFTAVGANSVVMPGNTIPEGTVIGALSMVPASFPMQPWSIYAGVPVRLLGRRNRENVMRQVHELEAAIGRVQA